MGPFLHKKYCYINNCIGTFKHFLHPKSSRFLLILKEIRSIFCEPPKVLWALGTGSPGSWKDAGPEARQKWGWDSRKSWPSPCTALQQLRKKKKNRQGTAEKGLVIQTSNACGGISSSFWKMSLGLFPHLPTNSYPLPHYFLTKTFSRAKSTPASFVETVDALRWSSL